MRDLSIEYHDENGECPWVVVVRTREAERWSAFRTLPEAQQQLNKYATWAQEMEADNAVVNGK